MVIGYASTFAWYQVAGVTQQYAAKQESGVFNTKTSSAELGSFTLTPILTAPTENIVLTDNNGATFVYVGEDTTDEVAATAGSYALYGTGKVKLKVTYNGSLTTAAEVNAAWQQSLAAAKVTISDESVAYDADEAPNGVRDGEGLKFFAAAPSVGAGNYAGASTIDISFPTSVLDDLVFTKSGSFNEPATDDVSFYVAVKGVDGLAQLSTTEYTIGGTAANA